MLGDHTLRFAGQGETLLATVSREHLGFDPTRVWNPSPSRHHRVEPYSLPQVIRIGMWDFDETSAKYSPPPFTIIVENEDRRACIGVAAAAGWHRWNRVDFSVHAGGVDVQIDLEGQTPAMAMAEHVHLHIMQGRHHETRHDLLRRGLAAAYPHSPEDSPIQPEWWRRPIYCGWGDQVSTSMWLEGVGREARAINYCTQGLYERWVRRLESADVPFGTVIIDNGWSPAGTWEPNPDRWPDLRGFIDRQHALGRKVLLWLATWLCEGLPDEWCVFADDCKLCADPTNPEYRAYVKAQVRRLLSPEGLDADGFKIDQLNYVPSRRWPSGGAQFGRTKRLGPLSEPLRLAGHGWGCELLYSLQKDIHVAAKSAKPDCLITSSTVHPYFRDTFDMVRLHDTGRIPPDIIGAMKARSDLALAAFPDKPIDTDDWIHTDYAAWKTYTCHSAVLGVPCIFYAERFQQNWYDEPATREIPLTELREIGESWRREYRPARELDGVAGGRA